MRSTGWNFERPTFFYPTYIPLYKHQRSQYQTRKKKYKVFPRRPYERRIESRDNLFNRERNKWSLVSVTGTVPLHRASDSKWH